MSPVPDEVDGDFPVVVLTEPPPSAEHQPGWGWATLGLTLMLLLIGPLLNFSGVHPDIAFTAAFGVTPAIVILTTVWVVLGDHRWALRGLVVLVVLVASGASLYFSMIVDGGASAFTPLFVFVASSVPLLLLRTRLRWRICPVAERPTSQGQIQFGVKHLLGLTFVFAVALAVLRAFSETLSPLIHDSELVSLLMILGGAGTCVGVAACCSALGKNPAAIAGGVFFCMLATVIEILLVEMTLAPPNNEYVGYLMCMNGITWLVDTVLVFGLRGMGLRLYSV